MRIAEIGETGVDGGDAVDAADAGMAGMSGSGSEEATETSGPAVRLSPRRGWSERITVRPQDMSQLFSRVNQFRNTADEVAAQNRSAP